MGILRLFMCLIWGGLNLRFLPVGVVQWLLGTGTRMLGMFSAVVMMAAAVFLWLRQDYLVGVELWLVHFPVSRLILILMVIAVAQLVTIFFHSARSHLVLGCLLIISALVWAILSKFLLINRWSLNFLGTYALLIVVCAVAGRLLIYQAKQQLDAMNNEGQ